MPAGEAPKQLQRMGRPPVGCARRGYAPGMELLVIAGLVVVVAVVVLRRKGRPRPPDEPESTGNDPR
ncbi:hypothetical protein [Nocardia sp. SSK8]|uniref:hypothetical protein n=1 Tax=Nocardia sp. SSK8 TaxID=3120154 RepID=UPI00300B958C